MLYAAIAAELHAAAESRVRGGEWTVRGLARAAHISQPQMHRWIHGTRQLSPEASDRLIAALYLDPAKLAQAACQRRIR